MSRIASTGFTLIAIFVIGVGCKPDGPQRYPVSGAVSVGGMPLQSGWIFFDPDLSKQSDGPQGFAQIEGGRYDTTLGRGRGVVGGPLKVRIEGESEINGQRMVVEYNTSADLPMDRASQDFELPASAARKAPPPGVQP